MKARAVLLVVLIAAAAACSSGKGHPVTSPPTSTRADTTPDPNVGLVQGSLGGRTGGGIVLATGKAGARFSTSANGQGHFVLRLPPGRYKIAGRSFPLYSDGRTDCTAPRQVTVKARSTTAISLTCAPR